MIGVILFIENSYKIYKDFGSGRGYMNVHIRH